MRASQLFLQTFKEVPNDAQVPSHQLLYRAGFILKSGSGLYNYSHLMCRVIKKTEAIIREELDKIGCIEVALSIVTSSELWKESARWEELGDLMLKCTDRSKRDVCISPTNEEAMVDYFRKIAKSYKQLPICLYQINTKFRDEIRPRFGLMRAREFSMKDAYSFHINKQCLDKTYQTLLQAYKAIFSALSLEVIIVEADGGTMAGAEAKTHEFQVVADTGEDTMIVSQEEGYFANVEAAVTKRPKVEGVYEEKEPEIIDTVNMTSMKDVCHYVSIPLHQALKAVVFSGITKSRKKCIIACCLGDDEINELKVAKEAKVDQLIPATDEEMRHYQLEKGYVGPIKLDKQIVVLVDSHIDLNVNYLVGANKKNKHIKNIRLNRDVNHYKQADIRRSKKGDLTKKGSPISIKKGIEVGHIFQLGDKYTRSLNSTVLDPNGKAIYPLMGCYGIGIGRTVAAAVEQCHDSEGIIWPKKIAPYELVIFPASMKDNELVAESESLYDQLIKESREVLLDDREISIGMKFKDADLIGYPIQIVIGKEFKKHKKLECIIRNGKKKEMIEYNKIVDYLNKNLP